MAAKQWRCFFCDEVFTRAKDAAEHFGVFDSCEADIPACKLTEHEGHMLKYIRRLEAELRRHLREDTDLHRAIASLETESAGKIRAAEEKGYANGVSDMKAQGLCADPAAHNLSMVA